MRNRNPDGPAYLLLLKKYGLVNPREYDAFHLYMRLCEDEVVSERSKKLAAGKRAAYLAGFASGYKHAATVLQQMSKKDLAALRARLGIRPEKEFAVR
jgi:hypothetical protein